MTECPSIMYKTLCVILFMRERERERWGWGKAMYDSCINTGCWGEGALEYADHKPMFPFVLKLFSGVFLKGSQSN